MATIYGSPGDVMPLTSQQEEALNDALALADHPRLTQWERNFLQQLAEQYEEKGAKGTVVSGKMWGILQRIERKLDHEV